MAQGKAVSRSISGRNLAPGAAILKPERAPKGTVVFVQQPRDELICPICQELLQGASSLTHCGHWFCETCINEHIKCAGAVCPCCRTQGIEGQVIKQHNVRSEISSLKAYCRHGLVKKGGKGPWVPGDGGPGLCSETLTMDTLEEHERKCPKAPTLCRYPGCGAEICREEVAAHEAEFLSQHLDLAMERLRLSEQELRRSEERHEVTRRELEAERRLRLYAEARAGGGGDLAATAHFLPGQRAISASLDKTLKVWRVEDGECLATLEGHKGPVQAVAVLPGGDRIVSASCDKTLKVWRVADGACELTMEGHEYWVNAVMILPRHRAIVSASDDCSIRVWHMQTGECLRTLEGHDDRVSAVAALPCEQYIVSASRDKSLRVWQSGSDWRSIWTLRGHEDEVTVVTALHHLLDHVVSGSRDRTLRIWNLRTGSCVRTLSGHTGGVQALAVLGAGDRVVSAADDKTFRVWRVEDGTCEAEHAGQDALVTGLDTLSGNRFLSSAYDKTVKVWRGDDGRCSVTMSGHSHWVMAVAVL